MFRRLSRITRMRRMSACMLLGKESVFLNKYNGRGKKEGEGGKNNEPRLTDPVTPERFEIHGHDV